MQMVLSIRKGYQRILQFYSLNVLNLHQVLRPYWVMIQAGDSSEASSSKQTTISVCTNEQLVTKAEIIWALDVVMSKQGGANRECVWGCNTPPLPPPPQHTHTHTLFLNLLVFWQNVSVKFPDPMLSVNLEYFIKNEMQISINIQSCRFYRRWRLLKKLL